MLIVSLDCSFLILKNEQSRNKQHWAQDKNEEKQKKNKSRMNNLETQSTLGTRQGRRQTKEKQNQE
jgi:mannitol-specific phosphotransferase system IIBC component